ncbi:MAG: 7-cyano-7-deazaguanine synthase QueC [Gammaproteobacteria bacterium]|nr:7-cyano-7-deazaguanine synthase QueC [Gammaproteobacteria bacterium]
MTAQAVGDGAIVLLSGGLDSATVLADALEQGYQVYTLSFDYGQRHYSELNAARQLAQNSKVVEHRVMDLNALGALGGSALTDKTISVPEQGGAAIPVTYVPARNTVFLSYALAWAEVLRVNDVFIGVNAVDYSGYPDCRPEFIQAFADMANLATKVAVEGQSFRLHTPLIDMSKAEIICRGNELGVDYSLTVSCYQADSKGYACGHCDACRLRAEGFRVAEIPDPTRYC